MTDPDGTSARPRLRRIARAALREPLVHFALLAAVPFAVHGAAAEGRDRPREPIVVSDAFLEELATRTAQRTGADPAAVDRDALAGDFRREEALYREARRLGLDRGDPIVRRRLVQKMEFLLEGRVEVPEPDDATLARYLADEPERFREPARVTFDQVFFVGDDATARAAAVLTELGPDADAPRVAERGDAFPLGATHGPLPVAAVESRLGASLAEAVADAPLGRWSGPVASEWGAHLVRVRERTEPRLPELSPIRSEVRRAFLEAQREAAMERLVRDVVDRWPLRRGGDRG